eukprot:CAMPEP_0204837186 /NCGR_PEP_ID=MMETSP1346-20131115/27282_1 /ASSEMBLY_ACC=CAM_ASM_000771 /TAXON_ID=215587 /ORGANISM="Aplanochytrium stocchinoi, Strain GSBS06" /LENGTH=273 /DNA_ID=CAMNT_0051972479 /DNA_START=100 /DNA_END=922 /DNA_ORIENTATION=-
MVEFCLSTNQLGYLGAGAALLYALKRLITRIPIDSVLSETASGPHSQLLVVVTGSTKGIGLSMCKEFLRKNDLVVVSSRNENHVKNAVENLKKEHSGSQIVGKTADVTKEEEMLELCDFASAYFGKPVDVFICNAGITQQKKNPITQVSENEIEQIILTNLVGAINGYKAAAMNMQKNNKTSKGHIFLMEGAGSLGRATPNFASYGVSKAGYLQLLKSLKAEAKEIGVSVHTISPGMVITDLLLGSASGAFAYKIFNILAEMPETVSAYLSRE